jgi:hypothetical protein
LLHGAAKESSLPSVGSPPQNEGFLVLFSKADSGLGDGA